NEVSATPAAFSIYRGTPFSWWCFDVLSLPEISKRECTDGPGLFLPAGSIMLTTYPSLIAGIHVLSDTTDKIDFYH
ncbi:MAG: hypothetical protein LBS67_05950, partial [Clostridiales Family XIII bacterium]|nr:hypothetical protein [Clostridiales Family XIII bacterium]